MITTKDIENLASLARIEIGEGEKESMRKDIENILEYVSQVKNISSGDVSSTSVLRNVMRDDVVTHSAGEYTEDLLSLAPNREGNYLKVKKIL